ncbi:hypothetical protein F3J44_12345 [Pantoea sp. Tr-811]|nr:hypothetical protein [Pantoea sp. Tr-811]
MPEKHHKNKYSELHPHGNQKCRGINNRHEFNIWKRESLAYQANKELARRSKAPSTTSTITGRYHQ